MEILRKLPPDTIVIRQKMKSDIEESDYRELIETNSNDSSSIPGCADVKKGISRAVRNKTLKTIEVRRNPMRMSKRNVDKDFSRPKQLLANNKKEFYLDYEFEKRIKSSAMPYMNTRSITRKMYTVGATYQAPTKKDETEWKEWPVHGMHERPVYHPQTGLAVEYLGKYFTSLDGLSYCEIISKPNIEVISVDPHYNKQISSTEKEKKLKRKIKMKNKRSSNTKNAWNTYLSMDKKSFETCMHKSLHCVFGYCAQVMTPVYKQAVEKKMTQLTISATKTSSLELTKETTNVKSNLTISPENIANLAEETKLLEAYAIAMAQNIQNESTTNSKNDQRVASAFPSSSALYIPKTQKSTVELNSSKTTSQNREMIRMNLKQIIRGTPNSSLILLKNSAKSISDEVCTKNIFNSAKLEDASSNETMMGMSIYRKLFAKESVSKCKESPVNNLHTLKRYATKTTQEYMTKKTFLETPLDKKTVQVMKQVHEEENLEKTKINRESDGRISNSDKNLVWCTNETSKIAKILSNYNKSMLRKSMIQNQIYNSRDMKTSLTKLNIKNFPKSLTQKNITVEKNQQFISNSPYPNMSFGFSQGKWKKLHLMLENTKDSQIVDSNQNAWKSSSTLLENHKVTSSKNEQVSLNTLNYIKKKPNDSHKDLNRYEIIGIKPKEKKSECSRDETETSKMGSLRELLENTAILYCTANGVHQDNLSNYIDTLDNKQSIQWLKTCNNSVTFNKKLNMK
ncbi:hypothetical protein ALC57_14238 [Trachymyrmex cornetzi]|uniref:Uncharacterized protein n=2 Tax=Trachymyrmex cornetzi TaxID=471704 RepID=A0A195DKY0_9HYME|nr:hypothetical protein ALC57_14238 [Trachymyrmex cornetzi]